MGLIFKKNKKQLTPEQHRRRFYISAGFVAFMVIVCLAGTLRKGDGKDDAKEINRRLDEQLDTLLRTVFGHDPEHVFINNLTIYTVGDDLADRIVETNEQLQLLSGICDATGSAAFVESLSAKRSELDSLLKAAKEEKDEDRPLYYIRHLEITDSSGRAVWSAFQHSRSDFSGGELRRLVRKDAAFQVDTTLIHRIEETPFLKNENNK